MDKIFTAKLRAYMELPPESRDLEKGAEMLLQLTRNQIMYRQMIMNPEKYREHLFYQLEKFLGARIQTVTHEQVEAMALKADGIVDKHLSLTEDNPASEFKAGRRADHDSLPEEVQALYVENKNIVQRMREVHTRLRLMMERNAGQVCPDSDRYPFLKELISLDEQLHRNWEKYDSWNVERGEILFREDARVEAKKILKVLNLQKGLYRKKPSDERAGKIAELYAQLPEAPESLTEELRALGIIG